MNSSILRHNCLRNVMVSMTGLAAVALLAPACESIYDGEGDCGVTYSVPFTQTMNILGADAFAARVGSVSLYVFDLNGRLVASKTESGAALASGQYAMDFSGDELAPGTYDLIAWGGLTGNDAFGLAGGSHPVSKDDLVCLLHREHEDDGTAVSARQLRDLFHGADRVEFPAVSGYHRLEKPVDLTKDNNTIRVILQHFNERPLDKDDFSFTIVDDNGKINHDNVPLPDESIVYSEWAKNEVLVERPDDTRAASVSSIVAEVDVARLMTDHKSRLRVWVKGKDKPVIDMNLPDLLLLAKGEAKRAMSDQEYLDRQDDYTLFFYLDDAYGWYTRGGVWVNSWHVVFQDQDL